MNTAADNYDFNLVGTDKAPFLGYISAEDPTRLSPQIMVRGSQNVFLENSGDIANREGLKRYDPADNADNPVVSSFDWNDVEGNLLLIRVLRDGELQFYRTEDETWYTLGEFPDNTDFSYAKWWSLSEAKELLVMCNGTTNLYAWSGGISADGVGEVNVDNSLYFTFPGPIDFSIDTVPDGSLTAALPTENQVGVVMESNPANLDTMEGLIVSGATSQLFTIVFVDTLTVAPGPAAAQVLIGTDIQATLQNIVSLFADPGTDNSTQRGFSDADLLNLLPSVTVAIQDTLESPTGTTWAELGFVSNSSIIINGVSYSYGLLVQNYMMNINGNPPEDQFAYEGLITTPNSSDTGGTIEYPPMADSTNDFLLCLNNQLIVCSYTSRIVNISYNEDYTQFTQAGDLIFGDPDFVILDEFPKGGTTRGDSAYIGAGQNSWYEITPNTVLPTDSSALSRTVYTKVTKFSGAGLTAPLGFNFVGNLLEDIVYVDQQNQLRTLGIYRNIVQQKSPSLSIALRRELQAEDFTGGCLRSVGEYTYLVSPISGRTYLYQIRDDIDDVGNVTAQRLWQPPQIWNISRVAVINGIPHGYSNTNPQLYQLIGTGIYHDQTSVAGVQSPYISRVRFAYRSTRDEIMKFDKIYYEGYILPSSDLQAKTYYNYQGGTHIEDKILSSQTITPTLFTNDETNLIGDSLIGDVTIGGGSLDPNYPIAIPKFRVITNMPVKDVFEYQLELFSEASDSQWALVALGGNEKPSINQPVELQINNVLS